MSDLTTMTPTEIDTELAGYYYERIGLAQKQQWALVAMHHATEQKRWQKEWTLTDQEALDQARAAITADPEAYTYGNGSTGNGGHVRDSLATLIEVDRRNEELLGLIRERQEEWERRGRWSRFYLVKNNGGHIHRSMECSTCYPTTWFAWLPALSGQSEAQAVAEQGPIMCTVCFPSAPVEWTIGHQKSYCPGSGKTVERDSASNVYRPWALCPDCNKAQSLTQYGKIRKHQPPKGADA